MTEKRKAMTPARKKRILDAHDGKCWRCGEPFEDGEKIEYDHKLALCRGGTDDDDNIGPCHVPCHKLKTFGGNTKLGSDIFENAKTKRIKAKHEGLRPRGKHKIKSRNTLGMKGYRKKLDGTVERAEGRAKMS